MKKTVFIAALAVVAMASCTKNELKVPATGTDAVISFQPVVANATKASYITNTSIAPTGDPKSSTFKFKVYAWYTGELMATTTTASTATKYMDAVEVSYKAGHNDTTEGQGGWSPDKTYYWPKNGYLSFDAYAPSAASSDGTFSSDVQKGLQITSYTVKDLNQQYDLLYSKRTLNKKNSTEGATNDTYDGVDIAFKHALAAIEVTAKTGADYGNDAIKLQKITILNAYNKGTFTQGMTNAAAEGTAAWSKPSNETTYELFKSVDGVALTTTELSSTSDTNPISNAILLPQGFSHDGGNKVSIRVDYTIKHGDAELAQYYIADLSGTYDSMGGASPLQLSAWEIGKRYTYNFIFSLDEVYFAPSVDNWDDVTVDDITVK